VPNFVAIGQPVAEIRRINGFQGAGWPSAILDLSYACLNHPRIVTYFVVFIVVRNLVRIDRNTGVIVQNEVDIFMAYGVVKFLVAMW